MRFCFTFRSSSNFESGDAIASLDSRPLVAGICPAVVQYRKIHQVPRRVLFPRWISPTSRVSSEQDVAERRVYTRDTQVAPHEIITGCTPAVLQRCPDGMRMLRRVHQVSPGETGAQSERGLCLGKIRVQSRNAGIRDVHRWVEVIDWKDSILVSSDQDIVSLREQSRPKRLPILSPDMGCNAKVYSTISWHHRLWLGFGDRGGIHPSHPVKMWTGEREREREGAI